ncbi:MAG: hypothetical protein DWQ05_01570 [Calditrichaeota bacterium]|nr:MAG: hypothetical protein DWQ05_01570 [Calditrichota bacterium]
MLNRIFQHSSKWIVFLGVFFIFSNCGGTKSVQYFTIDMPSPVSSSTSEKTTDYLGIKQLDSGIMFHEDRLIYQDSQREIKYWNYKKWIAPPSVLLTEALKRNLSRAQIFHNVLDYPTSIQTRYVLEGKLNSFEEHDAIEGWTVRVGFELRLFDMELHKFIWEQSFENQAAVTEKTIAGVVQGFDNASSDCIQAAVEQISKLFDK